MTPIKLDTTMIMDPDGIVRPKPLPYTREQILEVFHSGYTVEQRRYETPCWVWTSSLNGVNSYGTIHSKGKKFWAHKLSLEIHVGPAPEGKPLALHKCHYRDCVCPDHLYWGTHKDNGRDKSESGRASRLSGETNPLSKLTNSIVISIRDDYAAGVANMTELGAMFGVHKTTAQRIVRRTTWKHID